MDTKEENGEGIGKASETVETPGIKTVNGKTPAEMYGNKTTEKKQRETIEDFSLQDGIGIAMLIIGFAALIGAFGSFVANAYALFDFYPFSYGKSTWVIILLLLCIAGIGGVHFMIRESELRTNIAGILFAAAGVLAFVAFLLDLEWHFALYLLALAVAFALIAMTLAGVLKNGLPATVAGCISIVVILISMVSDAVYYSMGFWHFITLLIFAATVVVAVFSIYHQYDVEKEFSQGKEPSIPKRVLFYIITLGIYEIKWVYDIIKKLQGFGIEDKSVAGQLLCFFFVPFYAFYWIYSRSDKLAGYGMQKHALAGSNAVVNLLLAIFALRIISIGIMQSDINRIAGGFRVYGSESRETPAAGGSVQEKARADGEPVSERGGTSEAAAKIRELKALFDEGILTEAEYEGKKKELLDKM